MKKSLALFLLSAIVALSQISTTSIVGPIYDSFGNPYTGSFVVQSQAKTNSGWAITGTVRTVYVNAGTIGSLSLVPNSTSLPNLTSYLLTFANQDRWICIVPTSTVAVAFTAVCSPNSTAPHQGDIFAASQLIGSPHVGDVLTTVTPGQTQWAPSPLAPAGVGVLAVNNGLPVPITVSGDGTIDPVTGVMKINSTGGIKWGTFAPPSVPGTYCVVIDSTATVTGVVPCTGVSTGATWNSAFGTSAWTSVGNKTWNQL